MSNEPGLYLYGDPVASVFSLYRRNYAIRQYARLNQKHMGGPLPANASEYVRNGTDVWFQYKKHMALWLKHCPNILAMTLTDMVDPGMLSLIAYHLNIPSSRIEGFNIAPRASPTTSDFDLPFYTKHIGYKNIKTTVPDCKNATKEDHGNGPKAARPSAANYIGECVALLWIDHNQQKIDCTYRTTGAHKPDFELISCRWLADISPPSQLARLDDYGSKPPVCSSILPAKSMSSQSLSIPLHKQNSSH